MIFSKGSTFQYKGIFYRVLTAAGKKKTEKKTEKWNLEKKAEKNQKNDREQKNKIEKCRSEV